MITRQSRLNVINAKNCQEATTSCLLESISNSINLEGVAIFVGNFCEQEEMETLADAVIGRAWRGRHKVSIVVSDKWLFVEPTENEDNSYEKIDGDYADLRKKELLEFYGL